MRELEQGDFYGDPIYQAHFGDVCINSVQTFSKNHCRFFEKEDKESVLWKNAAKLFGFIST